MALAGHEGSDATEVPEALEVEHGLTLDGPIGQLNSLFKGRWGLSLRTFNLNLGYRNFAVLGLVYVFSSISSSTLHSHFTFTFSSRLGPVEYYR